MSAPINSTSNVSLAIHAAATAAVEARREEVTDTVPTIVARLLPVSRFEARVARFNEVYELQQFHLATRKEMADRLAVFKKMLAEELDEIDEIIEKLMPPTGTLSEIEPLPGYNKPLEALTDLADLLGDLQVYCASEMVRFNLPVAPTLDIIMDSNMSKLGEDGRPIHREDGKVMKGPSYWKPEPKIAGMLSLHYAQDPSTAHLVSSIDGLLRAAAKLDAQGEKA